MKDRDAYTAEGRNDPRHPDQVREHPYDFVSLPDRVARVGAPAHDRYLSSRLSGTITFVYEILSPLHVGSGVLETADECGLAGGSKPVRGIARRNGVPVLPGSGWKGAVRARFEAITFSRLSVARDRGELPESKVPRVLRSAESSRKYHVLLKDPRLSNHLKPVSIQCKRADSDRDVTAKLAKLGPAESLFGAMGYRGRVLPSDGTLEAPRPEAPLRVAPMESPAVHRLAVPGAARSSGRGRIEISRVEGRKFYYDGPIVSCRRGQNGRSDPDIYEEIDFVPTGARLTIEVRLESVNEPELGALLVAAGYGENVGVVRFGGFKPAGLGKVRLESVEGRLAAGPATRRWRGGGGQPLDAAAAVQVALREHVINREALSELHQVTTFRRT